MLAVWLKESSDDIGYLQMPKQRWDRLDAEAEREGNAKKQLPRPKIVGHRLHKSRRMTAAGNRILETRAERRHV